MVLPARQGVQSTRVPRMGRGGAGRGEGHGFAVPGPVAVAPARWPTEA